MCFHKWSKWEQYVESGKAIGGILSPMKGKIYEYSERRQKRHCEKCNKEQDELVTIS